jgi:hypothetical protein
MKRLFNFIVASLVAGLLIVAPLYLVILLMLKAAASVGRLVKPFAGLLPEWLPAERLFLHRRRRPHTVWPRAHREA